MLVKNRAIKEEIKNGEKIHTSWYLGLLQEEKNAGEQCRPQLRGGGENKSKGVGKRSETA